MALDIEGFEELLFVDKLLIVKELFFVEEPLAEIEAEEILVKVDAGEEWLLVEPEILVERLLLRVEEVVVSSLPVQLQAIPKKDL